MRAPAAAALVLLLSGCGATSPHDELTARVGEVTQAANERDAAALRDAAQELGDTVSAQIDSGELPQERAASLLALADRLYEQADLVDPEVQARLRAEEQAREAERVAERERAARVAAEREAAEREAAAREAAEREAAAREAAAREAAAREAAADERGRGKGKGGDKDAEDAAEEAEDAAKDAAKDAEDED